MNAIGLHLLGIKPIIPPAFLIPETTKTEHRCAMCGCPFEKKSANQRYCSQPCARKFETQKRHVGELIEEPTKTCSCCKQTKPKERFYLLGNRMKRRSECKDCCNERKKAAKRRNRART